MNQSATHHNLNLTRMALDLATGGRPSNIAGKQDALAALAKLETELAGLRDDLASAIAERERIFALYTKGLDDCHRITAERDQLRARFDAIKSAQIYWALRNGEYIELIAKPESA